jgi:hypothetical protein
MVCGIKSGVLVSFAGLLFASIVGEQTALAISGKLSNPTEAVFKIEDDIPNNFSKDLAQVLLRYLAGNGRWEVRKKGDMYFGVRREKTSGMFPPGFGEEKPAEFETTLN